MGRGEQGRADKIKVAQLVIGGEARDTQKALLVYKVHSEIQLCEGFAALQVLYLCDVV